MHLLRFLFCLLTLHQVKSSSLDAIIQSVKYKKIAAVPTKNGHVIGYRADNLENTTLKQIWIYAGIPYALPPISGLRFKAPDTRLPWMTRLALFQRPGCVTSSGDAVSGLEDCLHLNIFSPVKPDPNIRMPVLVWIHGGAFFGGTGNLPPPFSYGYLENGVILVTVHYRLGVFGFLSTGDESSPGNYGIKDQLAALKWIKNNMKNFGGDPERVTIFGESAGAASVHYLLQAKQAKGLFHAAISDSGSSLSQWALNRNPKQLAYKIAQTIPITLRTNTTNELVKKLRLVNYIKLQLLSSQYNFNLANWNGLVWSPCIENEASPGAVVTGRSYERLLKGDYNQVPLLTGYNSNEMRIIFAPDFKISIPVSYFMQNITSLVPISMNVVDPGELNEVANKIAYHYFQSNTTASNISFSQFASDNMFVRPIYETARLMSQYSPVYLYRFAFTGGIGRSNFSVPGLGHGGELEFFFNIPEKTDEAKLTAKRALELWTNFAKYKNPTPQNVADPSTNLQWPTVASSGDVSYLNIDSDLTVLANPESMTFWEQLFDQYGNRPYDTYK